jgi:hypothetical protein
MQDNPSYQPDCIGLNAKGLMACGQRMQALPSNAQRCGNRAVKLLLKRTVIKADVRFVRLRYLAVDIGPE